MRALNGNAGNLSQWVWIVLLLSIQSLAFSAKVELPTTDVDTKDVARILGVWREMLSGSKVSYRVTEEAFDVLRKDEEGRPDLKKPKIKSRIALADVRLEISDNAILESTKLINVFDDGARTGESNGPESQEVGILFKDGTTTLYYPNDKYTWIRNGSHFDVPSIGINYDKLLLVAGFVGDFLNDAENIKITYTDDLITIESSKGELTIAIQHGMPRSVTAVYPYQTNEITFEYDGETKLPSRINLEVKAKEVDKLLQRTEWVREKVSTIPASTDLILTMPGDIQVDDDRNPN